MINQKDYRIEDLGEDDEGDWIVTFADLMAILLTFFVLLLSFSELNVQKFKELRERFNDEFSTVPRTSNAVIIAPSTLQTRPVDAPVETAQARAQREAASAEALSIQRWNEGAEALVNALRADIVEGTLDVLNSPEQIIIRIKEQAIFESGSAEVNPAFDHTLERIADSILRIEAKVKVSGHTDNQPIASDRFRSNWDLSAARAVTVAHYLMEPEDADPARFEVAGFADTQALADNSTPEQRALNRRVEILLVRPRSSP